MKQSKSSDLQWKERQLTFLMRSLVKDDRDLGKICLVLDSWLTKMQYALRFVWF